MSALERPSRWIGFVTATGAFFLLTLHSTDIGRSAGWPAFPLPFDLRLPAGGFIAVYLATGLAGLTAFLLFPAGRSFRTGTVAVLVAAAVVRLAALPQAASDDVNRYLWEGRILAAGLNPYTHAPVAADDPDADRYRNAADPLWSGINHPEMTAIYPPLALGLFAVVAAVAYDPLAIKLVMGGLDLAAVAVLLLLLRRRRVSPRWAILYALNPLAVQAFAGEGHLDAAQVLLLLVALLFAARRHWRMMFATLGLAVQMKYTAVVAVPFFLNRENARHAWLGLVVMVAPFAPFIASGGIGSIFTSLLRFGNDMGFNGFVHGWLRLMTGDLGLTTAICKGAGASVLIFGFGRWLRGHVPRRDPAAGVLFALSAFLLFAPTVHYWYIAAALALSALEGSLFWPLASATIAFGFVANGVAAETGTFHQPAWAQAATWALPTLLLAANPRWPRWPTFATPRSVSVIIPARDEAVWIEGAVRTTAADDCVVEVIVVDGGSADDTAARAARAGATVLLHDRPAAAGGGRGGQVARGLAAAAGDVVAIVHADTEVAPGAMKDMVNHLAANPRCIGGALGATFSGSSRFLSVIEIANQARAALLGISFGDQVQFFRRRPVVDAQIYPAIPLMEDVELSMRLRRHGQVAFLWQANRVSARRWQADGSARAILVVRLVATWLLKRRLGSADPVALYGRYYGAGWQGSTRRSVRSWKPGRTRRYLQAPIARWRADRSDS